MVEISRRTKLLEGAALDELNLAEIVASGEPVIVRSAVCHWPLVDAGRESPDKAIAYILSFYQGRPVVGYRGAPEIGGRFFYNAELTGFNFQGRRVALDVFLAELRSHLGEADPPAFYIGSTDLDLYLPGLREANGLPPALFGEARPTVSIWMGNRTIASAHFDFSNNIACNLVGRRRFTLFPPDQIHNLYPGPLEPTPGGQVVSMVDFDSPDFQKHPRFRHALEAAQVADLEPGDMLIYPAMWWHQVEALEPFNAMINYWWNESPAFVDTPMITLLHAMLSLRDRPEHEKQAWRELFDYYVFGPGERAAEHLPEHARGYLARMDEVSARRLRADLLRRLNR